MKQLFSVIAIAVAAFSCTQPAAPNSEAGSFSLDSAKAAINNANNIFSEAFAKGDSTALAGLYTDDACLLFANMPKICGKPAIQSFMSGAKKMGIGGISFVTVGVWGGKDIVSEEGTFEMTDLKGASMEKGKYIVLWKMDGGKWKIFRDVSNADKEGNTN